jgi:hypothetical protein
MWTVIEVLGIPPILKAHAVLGEMGKPSSQGCKALFPALPSNTTHHKRTWCHHYTPWGPPRQQHVGSSYYIDISYGTLPSGGGEDSVMYHKYLSLVSSLTRAKLEATVAQKMPSKA